MLTAERTGAAAPAGPFSLGRVLPVVLVATVVGTIVATSKYGIGLTPDSLAYVIGAHNIAHGHGYTLVGSAVTAFAPGYSAVLAVGDRLGLAPVHAARVLAVVSYVGLVLSSTVLVRRHVRSSALRAGAVVVIGCSAPLLEIYDKALSEHLFMIVIVLFALVLDGLFEHPASRRLTAAAIVLAWAAFYLRFAGIIVGAVAVLVIAIASLPEGWGAIIRRGALVAVGSLAAPVIWMVRNVHAGADPLGQRAPSSVSFTTNVSRVVNEISRWLVSDAAPTAARVLALTVVLVIVGLFLLRVLDTTRGRAALRPLVPLVLLVVVYLGYLIVSASIIAFAGLGLRFTVPALVPVIVLATALLELALETLERESVRRALAGVAIVWVALQGVWFVARAVHTARTGAGGYASAAFHDSAILPAFAGLHPTVPVYSNDPAAIDFFTGRSTHTTPARTFFASNRVTGQLRVFVTRVECSGHLQIVWLTNATHTQLYTPKQLATVVRMVPVLQRRDGVVYDVFPRGAQRSC